MIYLIGAKLKIYRGITMNEDWMLLDEHEPKDREVILCFDKDMGGFFVAEWSHEICYPKIIPTDGISWCYYGHVKSMRRPKWWTRIKKPKK